MNLGKELLIKSISKYLDEIHQMDGYYNHDLKQNIEDLYNLLCETPEALADFYPETIEQLLILTNNEKYLEELLRVRMLLIGRRNYNLTKEISAPSLDLISKFKTIINELLTNNNSIYVANRDEKDLLHLRKSLRDGNIITNFTLIEQIIRNYDIANFDENMVNVMRFINNNNLEILSNNSLTSTNYDIKYVRKARIDYRLKEILDKLDIDYKELPNYLIKELKQCKIDEVYNTFQLVKRNKAEDYGILHLLKKDNIIGKLILVLYATPESVRSVVDNLKDINNNLDINTLKVILNCALPCFLEKNNEYFHPKYKEFMANINLLKELGVNYRALITRNPLFMTTNNEIINYTLNYLELNGASRKKVINRCYKTITLNPQLLIDNLEVLKSFSIDTKKYLEEENNYNLLKITDLKFKIEKIMQQKNIPVSDTILLNKAIVARIYRQALENKETWSDSND